MSIGEKLATKNEVEVLRRKLQLALKGATIVQIESEETGVANFTDLADVPPSYAAAGSFAVRVASTVDALEFAELKGTSNQVTVTANAADFTLSLPQDIHTGASPTFVTAKLSALTDGYVSYHVSDAVGLANSVIRTDGTLIGIGMLPVTAQLEVDTSQIITSTTAAPYLKLINLSGTARDPIIQFAVGATPVTKFTMGVDDSDSDKFKLSLLDTLGAAGKDMISINSAGAMGFNTSNPDTDAQFIWVSTSKTPNTIYQETTSGWAAQVGWRTVARDWWVSGDSSPDVFCIEDRTYTLTNPYGLGVGEPKVILIDGGTQNLAFWKASTSSWGTNAVGVGMVGIVKTAPTTSPADAYQFWAQDFGAGGTACPFIRTEDGITVKLNQNVGTDGSPTFANITDSGLTATHPVFTDGSKVLVSTGTVPVDHGGTGFSVYAVGDVLYADTTTSLAKRAAVAAGSYLRSAGIGTPSVWSTLILPNAATAYRLPVATSANTIGELAAVGATGQYLAGNTGAIPSWANISAFEPALGNPGTSGWVLSSTDAGVRSWVAQSGGGGALNDLTDVVITAAAVGDIVRYDGSNWVDYPDSNYSPVAGSASIVTVGSITTGGWHGTTIAVDHGGTGLTTYAVGDILHATVATTLAGLADVAVGSYLRSGGVGAVPLWSTLILPNAATAYRLPVATSANTIGELIAVGATGEYLAGVTGAIPAWATLNQAAVAGLTTADGPTLDHVHLTSGQVGFPAVQVASADVNTLDDYEEGTWTPVIAFGGASVGVTYNEQTGTYVKIGKVVFYQFAVTLTSKGSSAGLATVSLPFTAAGYVAGLVGPYTALTYTAPLMQSTYGGNALAYWLHYPAGVTTNITNTAFANNTSVQGSGQYWIL